MRRLPLIALVLLAGCGGGDKLSAAEWRQHADTACQQASDAIAKGGWVRDLDELYRRVPGAVRAARSAITAIRAVPLPEGDRDARLFVEDLTALAPLLGDLARASEATDMRALANGTRRVESKLQAVQASAERAHLRRCLKRDIPWTAIDELRAPVAAEQLARLQVSLLDRLQRSGATSWVENVRRISAALLAHENALGSVKAPYWAIHEMGRYRSEVRDWRLRLQALVQRTRAGRPTTLAHVHAVEKKAALRFNRRVRELWDHMGADSVTPPSA